MGLIENIKRRGLKDITDPKVIRAYISWLWIELFGYNIKSKDILSFAEQIQYRALKCKPCLDNGTCLHCGCPAQEKISNPKSACSNYQWEKLMSAEDWKIYKEDNKITFILL